MVSNLISGFALIISLVGLYFSNLRAVNDIRAVVTNSPIVHYEKSSGKLSLTLDKFDVAFFNGGTLPFEIANVMGMVGTGTGNCDDLSMEGMTYNLSNFVVRAGEISIQETLDTRWNQTVDTQTTESTPVVTVCLTFDILTPNNPAQSSVIKLGVYKLWVNTDWTVVSEKTDSNPKTLFRRLDTILF